jgi:hypothetical protein
MNYFQNPQTTSSTITKPVRVNTGNCPLDLDDGSGKAVLENAGYCVAVLLLVINVFQAITGLLAELMQIIGKKYHLLAF